MRQILEMDDMESEAYEMLKEAQRALELSYRDIKGGYISAEEFIEICKETMSSVQNR